MRNSVGILLLVVLAGCDTDPNAAASSETASSETASSETASPRTARATDPARSLAPSSQRSTRATDAAQEGPGGQQTLTNREALIPSMCYTRTDGRHNPCYVCHQRPIEGDGHENRMDDGYLQGEYGFSDYALRNRWKNLFEDRRAEAAAITDDEIVAYVATDNYSPLKAKMAKAEGFRGYRPDLDGLERGADAFDAEGFAKDGSGWVAFNYMPMPSTFWPTNGATDDVMIRLPAPFRTDESGTPSRDVYRANLAILEAAIKGAADVDVARLDERRVKADLDGDGKQSTVTRLVRPNRFVGAAKDVEVTPFLYPAGVEFLHTVRYVGVDDAGRIDNPPRLKELRYMRKHTFIPAYALAGLYDNEIQEKLEGSPPYFSDFRERGIDNGFGWLVQGYIEDAEGALRPNRYEETLFCMGCHATIGSTIDKTFAFARKVDGAAGWGYIDLHGMPDAPSWGEEEGQIRTYLRRVGGGSEFRANDEMAERWFEHGALDEAAVAAAPDVYALITPSRSRALALNKAYRVIVKNQSFLTGRDPMLAPPEHVFPEIDREIAPLPRSHQYRWDIRVAWPD